jgi:hypothetical protein
MSQSEKFYIEYSINKKKEEQRYNLIPTKHEYDQILEFKTSDEAFESDKLKYKWKTK